MQLIDDLAGWKGDAPVTLIGLAGNAAERRAMLMALAARVLSLDPTRIEIQYRRDRRPLLVEPAGAGLHLSIASRGELTAVTVCQERVGVDIEATDESAEIPWNILHRDEVRMLKVMSGRAQALAFARLWTLKEAYLKALGVGFEREPSSFLVSFHNDEVATILDPEQRNDAVEARTTWRATGGIWNAVSTVVLASNEP